jgi:hypothetical protein
MLAEGDKFLLTAKLESEYGQGLIFANGKFGLGIGGVRGSGAPQNQSKDKKGGMYFFDVVMNKKPMWQYVYKGYHKKSFNWFEIEYETHMLHAKGFGDVIENKIYYKSMREEQVKNYMVLYE